MFFIASCAPPGENVPAADARYEKLPDGVVVDVEPGKLKIEVGTDSVIRVLYSPADTFPEINSLLVIERDRPAVDWSVEENGDTVSVSTKKIQARVALDTGTVTFLDADGNVVLREAGRTATPASWGSYPRRGPNLSGRLRFQPSASATQKAPDTSRT